MNFIVACVIAATVSLQTVKLGTAPGKTMVVTGATVSAASEISNVVTKAYVEGLGIEAGVSRPAATNIAEAVVREGVRTNYLCTVAAAQAMTNSVLAKAKADAAEYYFRRYPNEDMKDINNIGWYEEAVDEWYLGVNATTVVNGNLYLTEGTIVSAEYGGFSMLYSFPYEFTFPDVSGTFVVGSGTNYIDTSFALVEKIGQYEREILKYGNDGFFELYGTSLHASDSGMLSKSYPEGQTAFLMYMSDRNWLIYDYDHNHEKIASVKDIALATNALPAWTKSADKPTYTAAEVGAASQAELTPIATDARNAYGFSRGTYLYMNANTNSWFAATNFVFGADAATRTRFVWEEGMNAETVPCSMALYELRDGAKQCVWDQRDWTAWYWSFKAAQMNASIQAQMAASNAAIRAEIASTNNHAWAKWYAASGRVNPDPTTTYVDTPKVCIAPGMNWESVAEVSGCGYWTIVANGLVVGGSGTNAVLQIKDFEGNAIMTITKGAHRLAWLESEDFTGQMTDENGWVCFDMMADSQPTGYFSTTLDASDFFVQTDANCPAQYRWENLGGGEWRVHFLLKQGIVSNRCFAKFLSEVQGETKITYAAGAEISGGLIYNGRKIAPVIPAGASVGDTITWKVVE